jgi:hypothetical protein
MRAIYGSKRCPEFAGQLKSLQGSKLLDKIYILEKKTVDREILSKER